MIRFYKRSEYRKGVLLLIILQMQIIKHPIVMKKLQYILAALWLTLTGCLGLSMAETAAGVTVSGTVKFTNNGQTIENGISGTVYLLRPDGAVAYSCEVEDREVSNKWVRGYSIADVAAGTYTLSFEGKGVTGQGPDATLVYTEENVVAGSENLTKDITATINTDNTRGWLGFRVRYDEYGSYSSDFSGSPIVGAEVTCTPKGETIGKKAKTGSNGLIEFLVANGSNAKYVIVIKSGVAYADTTFEIDYTQNTKTVFVRKRQVVNVKLSGTVTLNGAALTNASNLGLKMGLIDFKGDRYQTNIKANGTYVFDAVPAGLATLYLHDENGDDQNRSHKYGIKTPADGEFTIGTEAENTQNVEIEKIAVEVSGTVKGLLPGFGDQAKITLTKTGTQAPAYEANVLVEGPNGTYKFPAVKAGTYAVAFARPGYAVKGTIADINIANLTNNVTIPEIKVDTVLFTVKFEGSAYVYNSAAERNEHLNGAQMELWTEDIPGTKLKDGITTDQNGGFSFTHEMKLGEGFRLKITHEKIKPAETKGKVERSTVTVQFTRLKLASAPDDPRLLPVENFAATWNATSDSLLLSWTWPDSLKLTNIYKITSVKLERRMEGATTPIHIAQWEKNNGFTFAALPKEHKDTIKDNASVCTYIFTIGYELPNPEDLKVEFRTNIARRPSYQLTCAVNNPSAGYIVKDNGTEPYTGGRIYEDVVVKLTAKIKVENNYKFKAWINVKGDTIGRSEDILVKMTQDTLLTALFYKESNDPDRYTLTLLVNEPSFGEVRGGGTFEDGTKVTAEAMAKEGYRFVEWQENGVVVANAGAEYTFTLTSDRTLTAIFEMIPLNNEDLQAAAWSVFAEKDGVLVIKGQTGDQYMVYDLNGRMVVQARCTGGELRVQLKTNQLYMVRRMTMGGRFDVKKIVLKQ